MKKINSIDEIHKILLNIAIVFDNICDKNRIPYVMLGGTMLGAVRHKGFIPWDDDMDFGVPRNYYSLLIDYLKVELPVGYKCLTYMNCEQIKYPFTKIEDSSTVIDDPRIKGKVDEKIGINIDIFPLDNCPPKGIKTWIVLFLIRLQTVLFVESTSQSKMKQMLRRLLRFLIPIKKGLILKRVERLLEKNSNMYYMGNILGRWKDKEIFQAEVYQETKDYMFENIKLKGVKNSHYYLTQLYGNYMDLPPIEQRNSHVQNAYYK